MKKHLLTISLFLYTITGFADCNPDASNCINTITGPLEQITKSHSGDDYSHLALNGKEIYKTKADYMVVGESDSDGIFKGKKISNDKSHYFICFR